MKDELETKIKTVQADECMVLAAWLTRASPHTTCHQHVLQTSCSVSASVTHVCFHNGQHSADSLLWIHTSLIQYTGAGHCTNYITCIPVVEHTIPSYGAQIFNDVMDNNEFVECLTYWPGYKSGSSAIY